MVDPMGLLAKVLADVESGEIVFLAGSGVSFASGAPSAQLVLDKTMQRYLPNVIPDLSSEVLVEDLATGTLPEAFQPEIFYEQLLLLAPPACLNGWQVLRRNIFPPNLNHLFLVAYSHAKRTPLITTNFDLLFEEAALQLGVRPVIYVPGDSPAQLTRPLEADEFRLWKVHGSVAADPHDWQARRDDPTPPSSLLTTMESISRVNPPLLGALEFSIRNKTLAFVGYSASDVDLFPQIRQMRPSLLWIDRNLSAGATSYLAEPMRRRLARVHGRALEWWPDEVFAEYCRIRGSLPNGHVIDPAIVGGKCADFKRGFNASAALDEVLEGQPDNQWNSQRERLLEVLLLKARGRYVPALRKAEVLYRELSAGGLPETVSIATLVAAQLSHERSRYVDCESYALRGIRALSDLPASERRPFRILFGCLAAEARRMQFAHDLHREVGFPLSNRFALRAFFALSTQLVRVLPRVVRPELPGSTGLSRDRTLRLYAQFEIIEHTIRLILFLRALVERVARGFPPLWRVARPPLTLALRWVDARCKRLGYAAGSANVRKTLGRIPGRGTDTQREAIEEGGDIYSVGHQETGIELSDRNLGDFYFDVGEIASAEAAYVKMLRGARGSGNVLNEIKARAAIGICRERTGRPAFSMLEFDEFKLLCEQVQGEDWQRAFGTVLGRFRPSSFSERR
jgi:hypothetical protein